MNSEDFISEPTIDTLLNPIDEFRKSVDARFEKAEQDARDFREEVQDRFDSIEQHLIIIRKDQLEMRMDMREMLAQIREHFPVLQ